MKKHTFKTAFALTLSLFMLVGCGFFLRGSDSRSLEKS